MQEPFETFEYRGCTIELHADDDAQNPRHEYDNAGNVAIWSRDYSLSDKKLDYDPNKYDPDQWARMMLGYYSNWDYEDLDDREDDWVWKKFSEKFIWLPLDCGYIYSGYGGISTDPEQDYFGRENSAYSTNWSQPDGLIFISKADAVKEWGNKICTKAVREKAIACLKAEIETYDQYLRGEVFGYIAKEPVGEDEDPEDAGEIESCWGFYPESGYGIDFYQCAIEQAKIAIDYWWDTMADRDQSGEHEFAGEPILQEA